MIPTAKLLIEFHPTNPPRPISCAVVVDGKPIAVVTLDDLRAAAAALPCPKCLGTGWPIDHDGRWKPCDCPAGEGCSAGGKKE